MEGWTDLDRTTVSRLPRPWLHSPKDGPVINWFTHYKDVIAGVAGIATAVGLLATSVAIFLAAIQIREQRRLNRANAVYEVQRDARQFAWQLLDDPMLATAVYGKAPDKSRAAIATAINFYSSVFQMRQHGVLNEYLWRLFAEDFMKMLEREQPKKQWNDSLDSFDACFVADIQRRSDQARRSDDRVV